MLDEFDNGIKKLTSKYKPTNDRTVYAKLTMRIIIKQKSFFVFLY